MFGPMNEGVIVKWYTIDWYWLVVSRFFSVVAYNVEEPVLITIPKTRPSAIIQRAGITLQLFLFYQ